MGALAALSVIFGVLGAGFSIFHGVRRSREQQDEIAAQQERERVMREAQIKEQKASTRRGVDYAVQSFKNEQEDAFRKANDIWHQGERIDMRADLDETLTGRAFNLAMQKSNMEDESLLLQQQRGKQNFLNRQGAQQTALGMSGARHGANSAEQLLEQNGQNFTQDLDLMNRQRETQKDINLMQAFTNLKRGMFGIDEERDQANKAFRDSKQLRDDYTGEIVNEDISDKKELEATYAQKGNTGGRVVKLFNKKIYNARADLNGNIDLQNLDGGFKQAALQRAYDRAAYTWMDGITDGVRGFTTGFQFGSKITGFAQSWGGGGGDASGGGGDASGGGGVSRNAAVGAGKADGMNNLFSDFQRSNALSARRYKDPFGYMFG